MMKTPKDELHDYTPETSESADVRAGFPLPLGAREMGGGVNFSIGLGIRSILHTDYRSTCAKLASFGLHDDEGVSHETG